MKTHVKPWRAAAIALVTWFGGMLIYVAIDGGHTVVAGLVFAAVAGALAPLVQVADKPEE